MQRVKNTENWMQHLERAEGGTSTTRRVAVSTKMSDERWQTWGKLAQWSRNRTAPKNWM